MKKKSAIQKARSSLKKAEAAHTPKSIKQKLTKKSQQRGKQGSKPALPTQVR